MARGVYKMLEIKGKYATAKVFADLVNSKALNQVREICNIPFMEGCKVRMMPDIHPGEGCVIGTTFEINNEKVIPGMVGYDIGCGMLLIKLGKTAIDLDKIELVIKSKVPSGAAIRETEHKLMKNIDLRGLKCRSGIHMSKAFLSLGTLGGGNHFIELNRDSNENVYLVVHSGSRHLGAQVAAYYQREANASIRNREYNAEVAIIVKKYKALGNEKELQRVIKEFQKNNTKDRIDTGLAYCEGRLFWEYIHDMQIAQQYASLNRKAIADEIVSGMGWRVVYEIETVHNYIEVPKYKEGRLILRKGAVSAKANEPLIIPINMEDGSLMCMGKGNADWNYSAPHGAGRILSRSEVKERYTTEEYEEVMRRSGVYTKSVNKSTLSECPMAYKPMESIVDNISDTVDIIDILTPLYNFKASSEETDETTEG